MNWRRVRVFLQTGTQNLYSFFLLIISLKKEISMLVNFPQLQISNQFTAVNIYFVPIHLFNAKSKNLQFFFHSKIKIADIGLQNPLVKKKNNTTQQQRETQVQKMKTANKVQKAKQTSRVVVWGVGRGDHFARKKIPIVQGCFNLTLSLTKHRTNLSSYYWNGVLVYNL